MAQTLALSGACIGKVGKISGALVAIGCDSYWDLWIRQAEGTVCAITRYNWMDNYTTGLNSDVKYILEDAVASLAAISAITWDMSSFNDRIAAEDAINVLRDAALRSMSILRDKKTQDFINAA